MYWTHSRIDIDCVDCNDILLPTKCGISSQGYSTRQERPSGSSSEFSIKFFQVQEWVSMPTLEGGDMMKKNDDHDNSYTNNYSNGDGEVKTNTTLRRRMKKNILTDEERRAS